MEARLIVSDPQGQTREYPLVRESVRLGGGLQDHLRMGSGFPASIIEFYFQPQFSTWSVLKLDASAHVVLNGLDPVSRHPIPLQNGTIVHVNGITVVFQQSAAEPQMNGSALRVIPLPKSGTLIFGRKNKDGSSDPLRVELDAEDHSISREHLKITKNQSSFLVEDVSRLGSSLNGDAFSKVTLVYGDRLQLGHYKFEFDGKALRWLNDSEAGSIVARNLTRKAGGKMILNNVSLQIRPGEFVGILGGSGQGKSTLLNALCGLIPSSEGLVKISNQSLTDKAGMRKLGIGYVPQDDIVHKELKVRDAFLLSGQLRINLPLPLIRARIDRIIVQLGLLEHQDKRIHQLSGGQRKRVSVGIELLSNPSVLFLDEPTSGLDPATEERLMVLLQSLALSGITVICTTHVLNNAYLFNRLVFIQQGRLVFSGNSDEARLHFLGNEAASIQDQLEAPLEKIYSALDDESISAEEREKTFQTSPYFQPIPKVSVGLSSSPISQVASRKVPAYKTLGVLLIRQWKILIADPLNVIFLLAQAVVISILIAWASDDIGMRAFITVIAAMWFGCSNAAQQIIGEILIVQRERVCGLGLNTYYFSKLSFLTILTAAQTVLLIVCTTILGNLWHPQELNKTDFAERLASRMTAVAGVEENNTAMDGDFVAQGDDEASSAIQPAAVAKQVDAVKTPAAPSAQTIKKLTYFASIFNIGQNLTESGPRDLLLKNGQRARDAKGKLLTFQGVSISKVLFSTVGLRILGFLLSGTIGVIIGLTISSLVRSPTQSVMWVPLILIPQILFGGFVIPYPEMSRSARIFCAAVPSFASQRLVEVSYIYGSATPFLSNRTKTPVFLTSDGSKETVEWSDGKGNLTQDYDRISLFNRAWQNLLVSPDNRGKHKSESSVVIGTFTTLMRDSVKQRADVAYRKGTVVTTLAPAMMALGTLAIWACIAYALTLLGLLTKKSVS